MAIPILKRASSKATPQVYTTSTADEGKVLTIQSDGTVDLSVAPGVVLDVSAGIDGLSTGTTTLFTAPAGLIPLGVVLEVTAASGVTVVPTVRLGVAAGENDILVARVATGLSALGKQFVYLVDGEAVSVDAASAIKLGVVAGTGTTLTLKAYLLGYYKATSVAAASQATPFQAWNAAQLTAPSTNFATFNSRNGHGVMEFDAATAEAAIAEGTLAQGYQSGTLNVALDWASDGATTGDVIWYVAWERIGPDAQDLDSDSFDTAKTATTTTSSTDGNTKRTTITFTSAEADDITAGDPYRLRITRGSATPGNATEAGDTMNSNDAQLLRIQIWEV